MMKIEEVNRIQQFIKGNFSVMTSDDAQFTYIKVLDKKNPGHPSILRINNGRQLGEGSFGSVHPAVRIEIKQNKEDKTISLEAKKTDLVVKKIKKPKKNKVSFKEKVKKENEFLKQHSNTSKLIEDKAHLYIVTDRIKGRELTTHLERKTTIEKLKLSDKLRLVNELFFELNLIHHTTPTTKQAIIHKDIKPENIMLDIEKNSEKKEKIKFNARVIDYGLSTLSRDEENGLQITGVEGTPFYMAPEVFKKAGNAKSDIFSMTAVVAQIIGVSFDDAMKNRRKGKNGKRGGFSINALTKKTQDTPLRLIGDFLNKMQAAKNEDRPDTETCMKFFMTMQQYVEKREEAQEKTASTKNAFTKIRYFFKKLFKLKPEIETMTEMTEILQKAKSIIANPTKKEWHVVSDGTKYALKETTSPSSSKAILGALPKIEPGEHKYYKKSKLTESDDTQEENQAENTRKPLVIKDTDSGFSSGTEDQQEENPDQGSHRSFSS